MYIYGGYPSFYHCTRLTLVAYNTNPMKKLYHLLFLIFFYSTTIFAQCDLGNYTSTLPIPLNSYPYTNTTGITVSAAIVNITPLTNFTYSCGGNSFTGASPAWWINAANASITLTFSSPVCNFTVLVNGTNTTEEFYFNANNGVINLSNFCTADYILTGTGSSLLCNGGSASGTIITVNNPAGATQYVLTHNGLAAGSRLSLLDCYVGCNIVPPTNVITCSIPNLSFCAGDTSTINYIATGPYIAGNTFTAQLSNGAGSFASPVNIGSVSSTTSGSIPVTFPIGSLTGAAYRVRVVSNNPVVTGSNNGTNITIHALPSVTANASPASVCIGGNLTLSGGGASTYSWSSGVSNGVTFVPSSGATYTVTGTDAFNCSNTSSVFVSVNPLPTVTVASVFPNDSVCAGTACILNGGGAISYTWTSSVINNVAFVPLNTNTYTVTGTDANNCSNTSSIQIVVHPLPTISIIVSPNDTICAGAPVTLTATGASTYNWNSGVQNGIAFVPNTSTLYTVVGTDIHNCTSSNSQQIQVNPLPIVNLGLDTNLCQGQSIVLNAFNPSSTYTWQNGSSNATFTANQTGWYWVIVNQNNCKVSDTIAITVNNYPNAYLGQDTSICEGTSIVLDVTCPGCTYVWQDNSVQSTLQVSQTAAYSVTVTHIGCSSSDTIQVTQLPLPIFSLGNDTSICKEDEIKLNVYRPFASYAWQDNSTKSTYTINDIGLYWVDVSVGPCTFRDDIQITPSSNCNCPVFVPNAFSPNGDGHNDEFRLLHTDNIELIRFNIYNRYGELVFTTDYPGSAWDGKYKGVDAEIGNYYYLVQYRCGYNAKETLLKGDLTLLR